MIGQTKLREIIDEQIEFDDFPRFSIIAGPKGSGKKTLALDIGTKLKNCQIYKVPDIKVETIRQMIADSYKTKTKSVYIISDVDSMSANAKNALLKVTEEPPNEAYFIMTVSDLSTVLDTIKSRARIYQMEPYTPEELMEYAQIGKEEVQNCDMILAMCETPGDIDELCKLGVENTYYYAEKVVDNIADVSSANAFKIANEIAFKDDDTKIPFVFFMRAFKSICGARLRLAVNRDDIEEQMWYSAGLKVVNNTMQQMNITGINKGALFDIFILNIREAWK